MLNVERPILEPSRLLKNCPHCRLRVRLSQWERMGEEALRERGSFSLGEKVRMRAFRPLGVWHRRSGVTPRLRAQRADYGAKPRLRVVPESIEWFDHYGR